MTKKWTTQERHAYRQELSKLYVVENRSITEISIILGLAPTTIYERLVKLKIPTLRSSKAGFNNQQRGIIIPPHSALLAEFIGIMLGDGHITPSQVTVTLGTKEAAYANFIEILINKLFNIKAHQLVRFNNYREVYFGSKTAVKWLLEIGLVHNKVRSQVGIPKWCFMERPYMASTLRGLFDTDGSIYRLRAGAQMSLTNRSIPLLKGAQYMLQYLGYSPSRISCDKIYLTRRTDIQRYFREIGFNNPKHEARFLTFYQSNN